MIRALILSPDPRLKGGVVSFAETLRCHFTDGVIAEHFQIGRRIGHYSWLTPFFFPLLDSVRLVRRLKHQDYNLVHLNPSLTAGALVRDGLFMTMLTAILKFENTIVCFHGWNGRTEMQIQNNWLVRTAFRHIFNRAKKILVLAPAFKESLIMMGFDPSKISVITTMFDGRLFKGIRAEPRSSDKTVIFLSRFVKEKGIYELLEAFKIVNEVFADARLVLAGDGPDKAAMQRWVERNNLWPYVTFTGYVQDAKKATTLMSADVFVLPSYQEGCPVSLLEAMAAGLPVIATAVGAIPDIIRNEVNGILLEDVTPASVATAIQRVIEDETLRRRAQKENRRKAWKNYEASIVAKRFEEIYREVGAGHRDRDR